MCSKGHGPRMTIPIHWDDDDIFIITTLQDALNDILRLNSGVIEIISRDEFGEEVKYIHKGLDLRKCIKEAMLYEKKAKDPEA